MPNSIIYESLLSNRSFILINLLYNYFILMILKNSPSIKITISSLNPILRHHRNHLPYTFLWPHEIRNIIYALHLPHSISLFLLPILSAPSRTNCSRPSARYNAPKRVRRKNSLYAFLLVRGNKIPTPLRARSTKKEQRDKGARVEKSPTRERAIGYSIVARTGKRDAASLMLAS